LVVFWVAAVGVGAVSGSVVSGSGSAREARNESSSSSPVWFTGVVEVVVVVSVGLVVDGPASEAFVCG